MEPKDFYLAFYSYASTLLTLSIGLLTLSITFIDKLKADLAKRDYLWIYVAWTLLIGAITCVLVSMYLNLNNQLQCASTCHVCKVPPENKHWLAAGAACAFTALIDFAVIGVLRLVASQRKAEKEVEKMMD